MSNPDEIEYPEVSVAEILAEMDELGRAKFNAALAAARLTKAMGRIAQLERQRSAEGA
jgi:hypothetical protein